VAGGGDHPPAALVVLHQSRTCTGENRRSPPADGKPSRPARSTPPGADGGPGQQETPQPGTRSWRPLICGRRDGGGTHAQRPPGAGQGSPSLRALSSRGQVDATSTRTRRPIPPFSAVLSGPIRIPSLRRSALPPAVLIRPSPAFSFASFHYELTLALHCTLSVTFPLRIAFASPCDRSRECRRASRNRRSESGRCVTGSQRRREWRVKLRSASDVGNQ